MENKDKVQEGLLSELRQAKERVIETEALIKKYQEQSLILKASEEKYRQIVQNANSIILLMDTQGNITFFNEFAQRFFGFYERDVLGKNVIGTIASREDLSGKDLARMIKGIVENPERYSTNENENMRSNGERVRVLWTNKAIIDDNGNIKEVLCVGNKITRAI